MCVTTSEDRARASAGIIGEKLSMGAKFFGKERWRSMTKYPMLKLLQVLCGAYICTVTFTKVGTFGTRGGLVDPESGFIIDTIFEENTNNGVILVKGDLRAVVAQTTFQMVALAVSRLSAFTMYPGMQVISFVLHPPLIQSSQPCHTCVSFNFCLSLQIPSDDKLFQPNLPWIFVPSQRFA